MGKADPSPLLYGYSGQSVPVKKRPHLSQQHHESNVGQKIFTGGHSASSLLARWACLLLLLIALLQSAHGAAPLAGATISNRATVTYFDTDAGFAATLHSNTVLVVVNAVEAVQIRGAQVFNRLPGTFVTVPYRVTNTGNTTSTYALTFGNAPGSSFELLELALYRDANSNGALDPAEPGLVQGGLVVLQPGQSLDLVLQALVGASVPLGQTAQINFTATSQVQRATATVRDSVVLASGASLQLEKSVSRLTAAPAGVLTYTLTSRNTGSSPAMGISLSLDGVVLPRVVIRDVVPANTQLVEVRASGSAIPMYHKVGDPPDSYTTAAPTDLTMVDAVAFGFASLNAGQTVVQAFDVKINANASGDIFNQARISFNNGATAPTSVTSNVTQTTVPQLPPTLNYYRDSGYVQQTSVAHVEQLVYLQADAAQCNLDSTLVENKTIIIRSAVTGDVETFVAKETGANTGTFRIVPSITLTGSATASGDGIVSTARNDTLSASLLGCGVREVQVNLLIDPYGVVYDARSNLPVSGATVTLLDVATSSPATVFEADGVTRAPSLVVTGSTGQYEFPNVAPGTYKLQIVAPTGYSFPSVLPVSLLPAARQTDASGSYGGSFPVTITTGPVRIDVPLDAGSLGGLFVEKSASRSTVELGEFVDYTVKIKNNSGQLLGQIQLEDHLPAGFAYVRNSARLNAGTTRLNGSALPEPEGGVGPQLIFNVGSIADTVVLSLTYRVRIGPGALQGDGVNRAQAFSARTTTSLGSKVSNLATASVQVLPGVFSDRGFVVGRVFADCNRDRLQNEGERGIPDVRMYMEDGTFVFSDKEGKFSLYNVRPQTHILKVDVTSLPEGAQLAVLGSRNARDAGSRFVDMKNGQLLQVNFAVDGCTPALGEEIERRAKRTRGVPETEFAAMARMTPDGVVPVVDIKLLPASGTVGMKALGGAASAASRGVLPLGKSAAVADRLDLDKLLPTMDPQLHILSPSDGQTFGVAQTDVVVKGAVGSIFVLRVNGVEVSSQRVGRKSVLESSGVQAWEYIGVDLRPGANRLDVEQQDSFGNSRGQTGIDVVASGKFSKLGVKVLTTGVPADGKTLTDVVVSVMDAQGVLVKGRMAVTLESSTGSWQAEDLDRREPGLQVFIEEGETTLKLLSPNEPGDGEIRASAGNITAHATVKFLPELRPLIAAGVVEGAINFRNLSTKALQPARAQDGFEQELRHFSRTSANGRRDAGARAALFLKGKVKGDYLLTLAYDSEKAAKERLFRDIQADEFYPVYGDDSVKGFDAQSTGLLYVRVDKGASFVLYGDFSTQSLTPFSGLPSRQLSQYNRSLNGARSHVEGELGSLNAFAARTSSRAFTEELPALGISGYYALSRNNIVPNSEKVEIITRDRHQPALIISTVAMTRLSDYEIEPLSGRLLFRTPVPSLDIGFNTNFVRVTYEYEQGGPQFWVYGVDGQIKVHERVEVGGAYVRDENPLDDFTMVGANVAVKLAEKTTLGAELAQTSNLLSGSGRGARVELKHEGESLQAQAFTGKTSLGFDNPSALLSKGRTESGVKAKLKIDALTGIRAEAIRSEDGVNNGAREGALLVLERNLGSNLNAEVGLRYANESSRPADAATAGVTPNQLTALHLKISGQVPKIPDLSVFTEYEQDVADSEKRMLAVGGEYRLMDRSKIYLRHELISSLGNPYTLNNTQQRNATVLGVDTSYMQDGQLISEYRLRDALTGREAEAAFGLRNQWTVAEGMRLQTGFEQVRTMSGADHRSIAVTGAIEYTANPDWKGSARLEYRTAVASDQMLATVGLAYKLSNDWTLLGRNVLQLQKSQTGDSRRQDRFQLGMAYRDSETKRWDALMRYEYKLEESATLQLVSERQVHVVSTHGAYQASTDLNFSGRYASKYVVEDSSGIKSRYTTHLLSARSDFDFAKEWTLGLNTGLLFSGDWRSRQIALGLEIGRILTKNLWLSLGYNRFGFRDDDLAGEGYTSKGMFLRLRYKFDENLFQ